MTRMEIDKKEICYTVTALFGMLLIGMSASGLLGWEGFIGVPIILVSIHLYYRHLRKKGKKFFTLGVILLPSCILLLVSASFSLPFYFTAFECPYLGDHHTIYEGSDHENWGGILYPPCSLHVAVNDETNIVCFNWEGPAAIVTPLPAPFCPIMSFWQVKDELGYKVKEIPIACHGTESLSYCNTGETWLTVKVKWNYNVGVYYAIVDCKVKLYLPHMPNCTLGDC